MPYQSNKDSSPRYLMDWESPGRLCMGAGPSNIHPRVIAAMAAPILGHMDVDMRFVLSDITHMLRVVFQTKNELTLPVSGTGSAGMEACLVNILEPGDVVVIAVNGYFGNRLSEVATRCGAEVRCVFHEFGQPVNPDSIRAELIRHSKVKAVAVVHAETSSGALSTLPKLSQIAHEAGALFLVDAVTSLGGVELRVDDWDIDICYSGTQKCMGCPPGLSPVTLNERARTAIRNRKVAVGSYYLDLELLQNYWNGPGYHHTASAPLIFSLREGLRLILEEGIENRYKRHIENARAFRAGVEAMGLSVLNAEEHSVPSLVVVEVPSGVDAAGVRDVLVNEFNTEISGGLGEQSSSIWRVGLMGHNSTIANVIHLLDSLEAALLRQGFEPPMGEGSRAARHAAGIA